MRCNYSYSDIQITDRPQTLLDGMRWYLDYLQDLVVEDFERKNLSQPYILEQKRFVERFKNTLESKGYLPDRMGFILSKKEVGLFHNFLIEKKYSAKTYNKHIVGIRTMYNAFMKEGYIDHNPFARVRMKYTVTNPDIIYEEELEKLFKIIRPENGHVQIGTTRKGKKNYYRAWLKDAILLALYTGERRDGVFLLQWRHVEENYLKIPNFKINRKQKVEDFHYVPITEDMAEFLMTLKRGNDDDYIIEPSHENRDTLKNQCSKSFSHFWSVAGFEKRKDFKALRKTLETRLWTMLGDKSKALKRHKNLSTTIDHYLGQEEILKELKGQKMFGFLHELNIPT
ncbi:tyrosine-type recombinase/integrase [Fulvivirga ligni]|uniref:tyrosine-type recombinase/integrase n=1 Tax=Fulvivirga ligni TaxID=2904246 RepID=UPI001F3498FC|nr:tyrosine-type recombinase/integrase [Fulvivirga ligni]UII19050.1 phage integrase SAM-like domain-containing protein [Fulvivirga ligni]